MENNKTNTGDFAKILEVVAHRSQDYLEEVNKKDNKKEYYFYLGMLYASSKLCEIYKSKGKTIEFDLSLSTAEKLWKLYNSEIKNDNQINMDDLIPGILGAIKEYLNKKDKSEE